MRLQEIFTQDEALKQLYWLNLHMKTSPSWTRWRDGGWGTTGSADCWIEFEEIPYELSVVEGNFNVSSRQITTMKNFPKVVESSLFVHDCGKLANFEGFPDVKGDVEFINCPLLTKPGEQLFRHLKGNIRKMQIRANLIDLTGIDEVPFEITTLRLLAPKIEKGGLGLLSIPGLETLIMPNLHDFDSAQAYEIIKSYLGRPDDIFECQAELIEAGLEKFAEL